MDETDELFVNGCTRPPPERTRPFAEQGHVIPLSFPGSHRFSYGLPNVALDTIVGPSAHPSIGTAAPAPGWPPPQSAPAAVAFPAPPPRFRTAKPLVVFLSTLYHLAIPERPHRLTCRSGALAALDVWGAGSVAGAVVRAPDGAPAEPATGATTEVGPIAATAAIPP